MQTPDCIKTKKWPDEQKCSIYVLKPKCYVLLAFLSASVQDMAAYVMMPVVIFVLVCSLTISEETVTFPDTSCFMPYWNALCWANCVITQIFNNPKHGFLHGFILFKYKVLIPYKSADKSMKANTDKSLGLCYFAQFNVCPSSNLDSKKFQRVMWVM